MGGVIFRILAAARGVVVLYKVLENIREEIPPTAECALKRELLQLLHDRTGEVRAAGYVGDERAKPLKQGNSRSTGGAGSE